MTNRNVFNKMLARFAPKTQLGFLGRALDQAWTSLITIAGVALLVFLALRLAPGDPVELMLGESAAPASRETLRSQLGLDRPAVAQLGHFANGLLHGDLGQSLTRRKPVTALIVSAAPYTLLLALAATLFANLVGIPFGVLAAYRPRSWLGRGIFTVSIILLALPVFWLGPLLILLLSLQWPWLPFSTPLSLQEDLSPLVLPTLTMGIGLAAVVAQTTRASVSECLRSDFIRTAHAKGASRLRVLFAHALPVAATPILTVSALQFGHLLAGAVITETIFDWPGLGKLAYDAILQRDYPTVQGVVLTVATTYVLLNLATDCLAARLNPGERPREQR